MPHKKEAYELGKEYNIKVDEITPLENITSK